MLFYRYPQKAVRFSIRHSHIAGICRPAACQEIQDTRSHNPANRLSLPFVGIRLSRRPEACTIALRKARKKKRAVSNVKKRGRFACKPATGARFSETPSVSRGFSPCLTFWYFWVKPKVQRKLGTSACGGLLCGMYCADFTHIFFLALSFEERAKEDREAKMVGKPPRTSLNDHERLRLSHDRSGRSVCSGFFARHFHIAETGRPKVCYPFHVRFR